MVMESLVMGCFAFGVVLSLRLDAGRRALRRVAAGIYTDRQLLSADPRLAQALMDVLRHSGRQADDRVPIEDLDAADVSGVDACFVRDRADDVAGLNAVLAADLDAVADELHVLARRPRRPLTAWLGVRPRLAAPALGVQRGTLRELLTT